jgi:hypothetical protein
MPNNTLAHHFILCKSIYVLTGLENSGRPLGG